MSAEMKPEIRKHFKGHEAVKFFVAHDSEDPNKLLAVYTHPDPETGEIKAWVRPLEMFEENVTRDGETKPRFENVRPATPDEVLAQFDFKP